MEKVRELLPENLFKGMLRKLGREETLRLLWPALVGEKLSSQTSLKTVRGTTLVVVVPDAQWTRSLQPMENMLVAAVNRFPDSWRAKKVEFVVDSSQLATVQKPAVHNAPSRPVVRSNSGRIGNDELREVFSVSEHKYFSRQEDPVQ